MAEPKAWITVNGRHIPIYEGETKRDAVKRMKSGIMTGREDRMNTDPAYKKRHNTSVQKEIDNANENIKKLKESLKRDKEFSEGRNAKEIEGRIKVWQKRLRDAKGKLVKDDAPKKANDKTKKYTVTAMGKEVKSFDTPKEADDYITQQIKSGNGISGDWNVKHNGLSGNWSEEAQERAKRRRK